MVNSTTKRAEARFPIGKRPQHVHYIGEDSHQSLGQIASVTADAEGKGKLCQLDFTLVERQGINFDPYIAKQKSLIQNGVELYEKLWGEVIEGAGELEGLPYSTYFDNVELIRHEHFFVTVDEIKRTAKVCLAQLNRYASTYKNEGHFKETVRQYNETSSLLWNHISCLWFIADANHQLDEDDFETWDDDIIASLTPKTVIAMFYLREATTSISQAKALIKHNGDTLLDKLSRKDLLYLFDNYPFGEKDELFQYIIETPSTFNKLTIQDIVHIIFPTGVFYRSEEKKLPAYDPNNFKEYYLKKDFVKNISHNRHMEKMAEIVLTRSSMLDSLLKDKKNFLPVLCQIPFDTLKDRMIDAHLPQAEQPNISLLDYIRSHMRREDWLRYKSESFLIGENKKVSEYMAQDEQICDLLSAQDLIDLIRWNERATIFLFNHPADSEVFILPSLPDEESLEKQKELLTHYIFIESEERLYYVQPNGFLKRLTRKIKLLDGGFKIDNFVQQLAILKAEQKAEDKIHLTPENVQKLILDNVGYYYRSKYVLRLTKACQAGEVEDDDLKSTRSNYRQYHTSELLPCTHWGRTIEIMEKYKWHEGRCSRTGDKPNSTESKPEPKPVADTSTTQTSKPKKSRKKRAKKCGPEQANTDDQSALSFNQKLVLGAGLSSALIGSIALTLIETGVLTGIGGPCLWPIALGLTILGVSLLAGLSLYACCSRNSLFHSDGEGSQPVAAYVNHAKVS